MIYRFLSAVAKRLPAYKRIFEKEELKMAAATSPLSERIADMKPVLKYLTRPFVVDTAKEEECPRLKSLSAPLSRAWAPKMVKLKYEERVGPKTLNFFLDEHGLFRMAWYCGLGGSHWHEVQDVTESELAGWMSGGTLAEQIYNILANKENDLELQLTAIRARRERFDAAIAAAVERHGERTTSPVEVRR